ncbi:MAG: thiamine phosphate synthase [Candidatus Lindowbacteria bacterium]|nr:thiamine phosphate synthase [Candidatus Lindowbacteria bacterium]
MCAVSDTRKLFPNLELYVIIDEGLLSLARVEEVLEKALEGGADAIQFRAKRLSKRQYYETAASLLPHTRRMNVPFFVNDHLDVALAIGADGVHLGQDDFPCREARRLVPEGIMVGISTHSVEQAVKAVADGADYVAIGPVFPTTTKEKPEPVVGLEMIRQTKVRAGSVPVIAIGGINSKNVAEVIRSGADGVALASAVALADDPIAAAKELKRRIRLERERTH